MPNVPTNVSAVCAKAVHELWSVSGQTAGFTHSFVIMPVCWVKTCVFVHQLYSVFPLVLHNFVAQYVSVGRAFYTSSTRLIKGTTI